MSPSSVSTQATSSYVSSASNETSVAKSKPSNYTQPRLDTGPSEVIKSIILWTLNMVSNHYSLHSAEGNGDLFPKMFLGGEIAKHFALSARRLSYIIHHGLASYFRIRVMKEVTLKGPRLSQKFQALSNLF